MFIIKSSGKKVEFDSKKVRSSMLRSGADLKTADAVLAELQKQLHSGMTTKQVYKIVYDELKRRTACTACRYNLRNALLRLGPAGYNFEKYVASILKAYSYDAHVPDQEIEGSCVMHEVDVVAEKDHRIIFIEAKFRNRFNDNVDLKDTMATWARFLDLVDGSAVGKCQHFDEAWIVTNARFSDRARQFGICKGIHMIGWNIPQERTFAKMVDNVSLYPVTVLDDLSQTELDKLSHHGIMLCKEVIEIDSNELQEKLDGSEKRAIEIIQMCSEVVGEE